jgi:pimeloyl-ACP methyl ester carboxylesterase
VAGQDVRYARNGDVEIAYDVLGTGPVDLVFIEGFVTHLELYWELPAYTRFCEQLAAFARLIRFDKRGMGLSDRTRVGTLEERMEDARAVMDAVGSERAAFLGESEGGPMSILFAARGCPGAGGVREPGLQKRARPWCDLGRPRTLGPACVMNST